MSNSSRSIKIEKTNQSKPTIANPTARTNQSQQKHKKVMGAKVTDQKTTLVVSRFEQLGYTRYLSPHC